MPRNEKEFFGSGNMVWTIIYRELNGNLASKIVYGAPDYATMWPLCQEKYRRLQALMPGNQRVFFAPPNS